MNASPRPEDQDIGDSFPSEIVAREAPPLPPPVKRELPRGEPADTAAIAEAAVRTTISREQILRERITREIEAREHMLHDPPIVAPRSTPAPARTPLAPPRRLPALPVLNPKVAWVLAVVVVGQFGVIAALLMRTPAAPPAKSALVIESARPGDTVMVNGAAVGATPYQLTVGSDTRSVSIVSAAGPIESGAATSGSEETAKTARAAGAAAAIPETTTSRQGGVRLQSPIELTVLEGDRVLGSTADPIFASAGTHQVEVVNTALGFRNRQALTFRGGQILTQRIALPTMPVSVNAQPWAQVFVDGTAVGETPLAKVPVTIGEHEFIFRHPQLGERRQKVVVRADVVTRVTATFDR